MRCDGAGSKMAHFGLCTVLDHHGVGEGSPVAEAFVDKQRGTVSGWVNAIADDGVFDISPIARRKMNGFDRLDV